MQFKDIVGQQELISRFISMAKNKHLPHALMLLGREGSGGLPLSLAVAQYINCTNKQEHDSCGECSSCIKMNKMQHPDVHFSFPVYRKESMNKPPVSNDYILEFREFVLNNPYGNDVDWLMNYLNTEKQGNITAAECREIILKLQMRSFESEMKIMIIWYPEYLDKEGNILLKLIEEPTANTLLFFVTTDLNAVLPTIQSRTQLFPLKKLSGKEIKDALLKKGIAENTATQFARLAEGNYNYALKLCAEPNDEMVDTLRNWLNCMYANKGIELVEWVNTMNDRNKETQKKFLEYVIQLLEHMIRFKNVSAESLTLLESEEKIIQILITKGMTEYMVAEIAEILNNSIYEIERNANTKILFHSLSLRIQKLVLRKAMA